MEKVRTKNKCICCKREIEGQWIFFNEKKDDRLVWVCNICNHLEKSESKK